jgi:hypothetical protein
VTGSSRPDSVPADWVSDDEFRAELVTIGCTAPLDRIAKWREAGLVPHPMQRAAYDRDGRVAGSSVWHPPVAAIQALAVQRLLKQRSLYDFAGAVLWLAGSSVDERYWRPKIQTAGATIVKVRRASRLLIRDKPTDENTFGERVTTPLGDLNGVFTRMARRIPNQQIPTAIDLVLSVASGQFDGFNVRDPDEGDLSDARLAESGMDLSAAQTDQIGGHGLSFKRLGAMLVEIAHSIDAFSPDKLSDEEIATARNDVLNSFKLVVCFHASMSWIYGPQAFGLRLASWVGRYAPLDVMFVGVVLFAELRRRSDQFMPSSQIAELAFITEKSWRTSTYFHDLQSNPKFAKSIELKRWKSAFEDSHQMENLINELAGYDFPMPEFKPWDQWKRLSGKTMPPGLLAMSIGAPNRLDPPAIAPGASDAPNP